MSSSSSGQENRAGSSVIPQKRPRPVKSCLSCRNKKLKCDQKQPCAQCIRKNQADQCDYDEQAGSLRGVEQNRQSSSVIDIAADDETANRASATEVTSGGSQERQTESGQVSNSTSTTALDEETVLFRNNLKRLKHAISAEKSSANDRQRVTNRSEFTARRNRQGNIQEITDSNKKFFGLNNTKSFISLFSEVGDFVNGSFSDPELKSELEKLNRMFPKDKRQSKTPTTASSDITSIHSIIPPYSVAEQHITAYALYFPKIHQVLHIPTFLQQFLRFYEFDRADNDGFREEFAPLLALVITFGAQYGDQSDIDARAEYQDTSKVCSLVESWISTLEYKRRLQPTALQTSCLLVLLKRLLHAPVIQLWHQTGDLVRSALAIGLNKSLAEIDPNMSAVQAGLRRRLWHVISYLDIELSISCCMPSLIQAMPNSGQTLTQEPSQDLEDPENCGREDDLLYQRPLSSLLRLNIRALQILYMTPVNIDEVRKLLVDIEYERSSLPLDIRFSDSTLAMHSPADSFNIMMLDMCFRGTLASLYTLSYQVDGVMQNSGDLARCMTLCMAIISQSEQLSESLESPNDGNLQAEQNLWELFHAFNQDIILRAAYNACHCIRGITKAYQKAHRNQNPNVATPSFYLGIPAPTVRRTIGDFVELYINKKSDLRGVLKQLIALALASEFTKPTRTDDTKREILTACLKKLFRLCGERNSREDAEIQHRTRGSVSSETSSSAPTLDFETFTWQDFDPR